MSTTIEERMIRWEQRQELMIASMGGILDTMEIIRDMISELAEWLKQPPSSDLSDLLKAQITQLNSLSEQSVQLGRKMDALPAATARAVATGEVG
jgi:hypothetical protein